MFSKSLFQSKTFYAFMAALMGTWGAYFQGSMDLQSAISASVMAAIGLGMRLISSGPVHLTSPIVATQDAPGAAVVKTPAASALIGGNGSQGGFVRVPALFLMLGVALLMLAGCAALEAAAPAPQTPAESVLYVEAAAASADSLADQLLRAKTISATEANTVLMASEALQAAVTTAKAFLLKSDTAGAQAQLQAVQADLAVVTAFLTAHTTK